MEKAPNPYLEITPPDHAHIALVRQYFESFPARFAIDPGVRETVITLCALDFPTIISCEGWNPTHPNYSPTHPRSANGFSSPLVMIGFFNNGFDYDQPTQTRLVEELKIKLAQLLEEFYLARSTESAFRLTCKKDNQYLSLTGSTNKFTSIEDYTKCKKEMDDFTTWLQQKFFPKT